MVLPYFPWYYLLTQTRSKDSCNMEGFTGLGRVAKPAKAGSSQSRGGNAACINPDTNRGMGSMTVQGELRPPSMARV